MQRKENQNKEGIKISKNVKVAIIVSEFNNDITLPMLEASKNTLLSSGITEKNIKIFDVPGAFEIPYVCKKIARSKKYDGIIAIGCVIRGDTDHYVYIANEATRGVMNVMLENNIPIANAILTVNNLEQAKIRSEGDTNKGIEAETALLKILSLKI